MLPNLLHERQRRKQIKKKVFDLLISSGLDWQMFAIFLIWAVYRAVEAFNYVFCVMWPQMKKDKIKIVNQMVNLGRSKSKL